MGRFENVGISSFVSSKYAIGRNWLGLDCLVWDRGNLLCQCAVSFVCLLAFAVTLI